jgi:hypothetical protein
LCLLVKGHTVRAEWLALGHVMLVRDGGEEVHDLQAVQLEVRREQASSHVREEKP